MSDRPPVLPLVAVGVTLVFWASAFVAIRHLGDHVGPGALSLGRLLVGSLCPAWSCSPGGPGGGRPGPTGCRWWRSLWFGVYNVALNEGERRVDAGTAAMLIQVSPVLIAVLAVLFLGALDADAVGRPRGRVRGSRHDQPRDQPGRRPRRARRAAVPALGRGLRGQRDPPEAADGAAAGPPGHLGGVHGRRGGLPAVRAVARRRPRLGVRRERIGWVVYLGVFPTAIAFTTYAFALTHMSASSLGVTTYLVPPITVVMAWLLLAETPPALAYVGGALCLVGVALARRRPRRRTPVTA